MHFAALSGNQLLADCDVRRVRRSGPGGQRRNKVETGVRLTHRPTGVVAEASERRTPQDNQRTAIRRLRVKLAIQFRPLHDDGIRLTEASELWQSRRVNKRISISLEHEDFPTLLAEAMDQVSACNWDTRAAADALEVSTSQLERFLKLDPAAFTYINQKRTERGKRENTELQS